MASVVLLWRRRWLSHEVVRVVAAVEVGRHVLRLHQRVVTPVGGKASTSTDYIHLIGRAGDKKPCCKHNTQSAERTTIGK